MDGAEALLATLAGAGVRVCFANPGTSEMHAVAALDAVPSMRAVLALFEGVATGAADGYARMADAPACVLLHLGPGLGNGFANLHNARRGHVPVVVVVGDHATSHRRLDAPLASDIPALAGALSGWVRTVDAPSEVGPAAAAAVAAASSAPGGVATLVVPADAAWGGGAAPAAPVAPAPPAAVPDGAVAAAAAALRSGEPAAVLLGGRTALRARGLRAAARVAAAAGAKLLAETFPARVERGAGLPEVERLGYLGEMVDRQLSGVRHLVLAGARPPVAFFAYPGRDGDLVPDGCTVHVLAGAGDDAADALGRLADALGAPGAAPGPAPAAGAPAAAPPEAPSGALTVQSVAAAVGATLPEGAVVSDESTTASLFLPAATAGAPRHDWLTLTGGAIGQGLPVATGAAVACPDRPVLCLQSDGAAMYTPQALWTQAREGLHVTTVLYNNRSYAILALELARMGRPSGPRARALFDLAEPPLDFVALARGMGVDAVRAADAGDLVAQLRRCHAEPGPHLVEVVVPAMG